MNAIMTGFIYLFMKRSHPPMREKKKTISHLTNEKKNNMNNLPSIKRNRSDDLHKDNTFFNLSKRNLIFLLKNFHHIQ